eukprot:8356970-Alexandrium_andersonii.AAC.1
MPAEAALSLTDPEYCAMARTHLATPVITSGLTCAKCRATLGPLGLHSHTCPGQTRRRRDVVERALRKEWPRCGLTVDSQPTGTSYRHVPDLVVVSPVHP